MVVNLVTSDALTIFNVKKHNDLTDLTIYLSNKQMVMYPLVNLFRLCERGPMAQSKVRGFTQPQNAGSFHRL